MPPAGEASLRSNGSRSAESGKTTLAPMDGSWWLDFLSADDEFRSLFKNGLSGAFVPKAGQNTANGGGGGRQAA